MKLPLHVLLVMLWMIPVAVQGYFEDVPVGHRYYDAVQFLDREGYLDDIAGTVLAPQRTLTRGEVLGWLFWRPTQQVPSSCIDVGAWYEKVLCAVAPLDAAYLVEGELRLEGYVTREELWRLLGVYYNWEATDSVDRVTTLELDMRSSNLYATRGEFLNTYARALLTSGGEGVFGGFVNGHDRPYPFLFVASDCDLGWQWNDALHVCQWSWWYRWSPWTLIREVQLFGWAARDVLLDRMGGGIGDGKIREEMVVYAPIDTPEGMPGEVLRTMRSLYPGPLLNMIGDVTFASDGLNNVTGAVMQSDHNMYTWDFLIDVMDSAEMDERFVMLVHEGAHLWSLGPAQMAYDRRAYLMRNDPSEAYAKKAAQYCTTYFGGEGCLNDDSYLYAYYEEFWSALEECPYVLGGDCVHYEDPAYAHYPAAFWETVGNDLLHPREAFITSYAMTNPGEDFAEHFTAFVLYPRWWNFGVVQPRIDFFARYPELVALRSYLRFRVR